VRELRNAMVRAAVLAGEDMIPGSTTTTGRDREDHVQSGDLGPGPQGPGHACVEPIEFDTLQIFPPDLAAG